MFQSSQLHAPILLKVVFGDDCFGAEDYAVAIREACAKFEIDIERNVTCIIGDNAAINDKVARLLNLIRAKCLAHGLNIVCKAITCCFPGFKKITTQLRGYIFEGGSTSRAKKLRTLGINTQKLNGYEDRWGSTVNVCNYLLLNSIENSQKINLDVIQQWFIAHKEKEASKASEAYRCNEIILEMLQSGFCSSTTGTCSTSRNAHLSPSLDNAILSITTQLELLLASQLTVKILPLITTASSAKTSISENFLVDLNLLGVFLRTYLKGHNACGLVQEAVEKCSMHLREDQQDTIVEVYTQVVKNALTVAVAKFDKHISVAIELLRRRFRFDPRNEPVEFVPPTSFKRRTEAIQLFFGCLPEDATSMLTVEYDMYRETYSSLSEVQKRIPMSFFWKSRKHLFPTLSKLGMWWSEIPTSSVAMERGFGMLRAMSTHLRMGMKEKKVRSEFMFRANGWIIR